MLIHLHSSGLQANAALQFTAAHTLGFSVVTSHILATNLSQSHSFLAISLPATSESQFTLTAAVCVYSGGPAFIGWLDLCYRACTPRERGGLSGFRRTGPIVLPGYDLTLFLKDTFYNTIPEVLGIAGA
jgi:hypothetical protein